MALRNTLTPRGMPTLGNKGPTRDRALFDCASRRTQGSSAEMVHEAAIAGSFVIILAIISYTAFLTCAINVIVHDVE